MDKLNELDDFIKKVTEIESVVKGLNSNDEKLVNESLKKADYLIRDEIEDGIVTKTGFSKTSIQKYDKEYPKPSSDITGLIPPSTDQETFMKILEKDAAERYERKKEANKKANELKEKGNEEFKLKNYEKAVEFYNEAMKQVKDNIAIYTNRAQTLIILKRYEDAIKDCDWALRLDEKCLKAMIHRGRALVYLKNYESALKQFEEAKLIEPKKADLIEQYVREAERCRQTDLEEESAKIFLNDNASKQEDDMLDLIKIINEKINRKDQSLMYYSGGLRAISSICSKDVTKKTLFRTQNGFKIFEEHTIISKYFLRETLDGLTYNELDLLTSCYELLEAVCVNCDENTRSLFNLRCYARNLNLILNEKCTQLNSNLKISLLNLLIYLSQNDLGVQLIFKHLDLMKLIQSLLNQVESCKNEFVQVKARSLEIIQNFFLDKNVLSLFKPNDIQIISPRLSSLLESNTNEIKLKHMVLTSIYKITCKTDLIQILISNETLWKELIKIESLLSSGLKENASENLTNVVLCSLINLCSKKTPQIESFSSEILEHGLKLLDSQPEYTLTLIGNLIQNSVSNRVKLLSQLDNYFIKNLIKNIKQSSSLHQSMKVLALCTSYESSYRKQLVEIDKSLYFLYNLFENKKQNSDSTLNEPVINNAILCMSHCVEDQTSLAKNLTKYNIIQDLLYLIGNAKSLELRKNSGILVAKLSSKHEKHLTRMRELDGFSYLKDCKV